jgi:hypothetical protein
MNPNGADGSRGPISSGPVAGVGSRMSTGKNVMETPDLTAFVTSVRKLMIFRYIVVFYMDFLS